MLSDQSSTLELLNKWLDRKKNNNRKIKKVAELQEHLLAIEPSSDIKYKRRVNKILLMREKILLMFH